MRWRLRTKIWLWPGEAPWHFATVPKNLADGIRSLSEGMRSPTGSVRVIVTAKRETWRTSLFPTKEKTYLLPIKAAVRKKAKIGVGGSVLFTLELEG